MKKAYWVRGIVVIVALLGLFISYVANNQLLFGICDNPYNFGSYEGCLDKGKFSVGSPFLYLSLSLLLSSVFLFFVSDIVFKKWLGFALVWILLSILLIVPAATHSGGIITGPTTKEEYAIFMSILFVPISLGILLFASWKERKSSK